MDVRNNSLLLNNLLSLGGNSNAAQKNTSVQNQPLPATKPTKKPQDSIDLSKESNQQNQSRSNNTAFTANPDRTFLVSERIETLDNGFRKLQEFESLTGKKFTKIEEVINSDDRSTRTIVQQGNTGSTTLLENVFDRQGDGSFRLTQRYTDENGDTKSNVQYNVQPDNKDFIVGRSPNPATSESNPFQVLRGTQFDASA